MKGNTSSRRWLVHRPGTICSLILSVASALTPVADAAPALAQGARPTPPANVPLPPRRPQSLDQPAAPAEPRPDPRPEGEPQHAPLDRETLRYCAARWQAMKADGSAAGLLWRDFSQDCAEQYRRGKR